MKSIKTKETVQTINTLNKESNLHHFEKIKHINVKKKDIRKDENINQERDGQQYATNSVINREKNILPKVEYQVCAVRNWKKQRKKNNKSIHKNIPIMYHGNNIKASKSTHQHYLDNTKKINIRNVNKQNKINIKNQTLVKNSQIKKGRRNKINFYNLRMKDIAINKYKKKKLKQSSKKAIKRSTNGAVIVSKNIYKVTKAIIKGVPKLMTIGMGFLLLCVISLFIGVFGALSYDTRVDSSTMNLSQEVIEYRMIIEQYAKKYDIEEYVPLIQAVMMQESGGKGSDPMQSSECPYNKKYPKKHNGITNAEYSIDVGVHYLSNCLKKANVESVSDIDNISLGLQGYNYGNGYIQWAINYFGGYTRANAKVFSDEKKAELQVKVYGDPDYVPHVLRYYHIGNGNMVDIAKSQVGNVGGKTYWSWYGFKSRVSWCACFVSWVANESRDLNVTVPKFSLVEDGISWYKNKGRWRDRSYIPKSGDLIFFDWNNDNDPDHVGIVEKVENNKVYTIEGNSKDECREKKYAISSKSIFGYGVI